MLFPTTLNKLKYILRLVVATPHYGWIIILQFLSGFFSIAGIPMLIPVIEYIRTDVPGERNLSYLHIFEKVFTFFGIEPSFYILLGVASSLILSGQILVFVSAIIAEYAQLEVAGEYRKKLFNYYLAVDWLWLTRDKSGEMNHAIIREAEQAGVAHLNSQRIAIYLIQIIAFLFITINLSFTVTIVAVVVYGVLFFFNSKNSNYVQRLSENFNETCKKLSSSTVNLLQNKKFFKASLLHEGFMKKVHGYVDKMIQTMKIVNLREQSQNSWTFLFAFSFLVGLIMLRGILGVDFSELLIVLLVFQRLSPQFNSLFLTYLTLNSNIPVHQSITNRLNELRKNKEVYGGEVFQYDKPIFFEDVNFSYPDSGRVIRNITIEINPFQSVAFVGSSGGGKSTILDLILGLLKPESGTIYYGDIPHHQLDIVDFRKRVAYVSQETTLLDGTLLENLAIGYSEATEELLKDICKKVRIDKFINELPKGLQTEIGENGIKLSGGQRQRVALGRALFMTPKILILDEATSDLDTETEMLIHETIKNLHQSMTIIIVAHRLSTVKSADMIYVIEDGCVCEAGTYSELLDKKGRLYHLNSLQQ